MNMNNNLVSIIIPCYNQSDFIIKCVESCVKQTYKNIEILIIDDGSTDDTKEIAKIVIRNNPKKSIKYIYQGNLGLSGARNTGIERSAGKYIQFLDTDDWLEDKKIEQQVDFLDKNIEIGIVYGSFKYEYLGKRITKLKEFIVSSIDNDKLLECILTEGVLMPVHCFLIRKVAFKNIGVFDTSLEGMEDTSFWIRCILNGIKFYFLEDKQASIYLIKRSSMSTNRKKMSMGFVHILESVRNRNTSDICEDIIKEKLLILYRTLAIISSIQRNNMEKCKYYKLMQAESDSKLLGWLSYLLHKCGYILLKKKEVLGHA